MEYFLSESRDVLNEVSRHTKHFYRPFKLKVKKKTRTIDNPIGTLRTIQQKIHQRMLKKVPLPKFMFGSVSKKDIVKNAKIHANQRMIVVVDLKNCFPNTTTDRIYQVYKIKLGFSPKIAALLTRLTTFKGHVPQGASTSSTLVNIVLLPLYTSIKRYCDLHKLKMSFWVDDIAFSGRDADKHLGRIIQFIQRNGYAVKKGKIKIMNRNFAQTVTGINVQQTTTVPKEKISRYEKDILNFFKERAEEKVELSPSIQGKLAHVAYVNTKQGEALLAKAKRLSKET